MKRFLIGIDRFVLHEIERASHGVQRLTGINCIRQSFGALVGYASFFTGWAVLSTHWLGLLAGVIPGMLLIVEYQLIGWREERAHARLAQGIANTRKIETVNIAIRLGSIPFSLAISVMQQRRDTAVIYLLGQLCWLLSLYLDACDPLPPAKSKIRQWLDSLKQQPVLAPMETR